MIAQKSTKDLDLGAETNDDNDMKGLARKADKRTFKERRRGKKKVSGGDQISTRTDAKVKKRTKKGLKKREVNRKP